MCVQRWLDALEEHTAYSSCNTTQEQTTEDEEGDGATLGDLTDSLQVGAILSHQQYIFHPMPHVHTHNQTGIQTNTD